MFAGGMLSAAKVIKNLPGFAAESCLKQSSQYGAAMTFSIYRPSIFEYGKQVLDVPMTI
jgi:hypothetical protein